MRKEIPGITRCAIGAVALLTLFAAATSWADHRPHRSKKKSTVSAYQTLTGEDPEALSNRWDAVYHQSKDYVYGKEPAPFLVESLPLLPARGRVLDLAMGEGRNAVFMAKKGYQVLGVDIAEEAVRRAHRLAREHKVGIKTVVADLTNYKITPDHYDVILVIEFLDRKLIPRIKAGLRKGGVVVFENHTVGNLKYNKTEQKEWLLEEGELRKLFEDFHVLKYREVDDGKQVMASLVARKP
jgi:SAM-dependent methyltransferase